MKKFEYKVDLVWGTPVQMNERLNYLGSMGWELVSIDWSEMSNGKQGGLAIFKKES